MSLIVSVPVRLCSTFHVAVRKMSSLSLSNSEDKVEAYKRREKAEPLFSSQKIKDTLILTKN